MANKKFQKLFLIGFTTLALLGAVCSLPAKAQQKVTIYFFNPETNINNLASLKLEFDTYLSAFGSYRFQPFGDRETFEKTISGKESGLFLLSSWHYKKLKQKLSLKPLLMGLQKGKTTHKKILSTKKKFKNPDKLKRKKVASSGSENYTRNVLKMIFGEGKKETLNSISILKVPKDIDALMAVGFGMADAALTTESSLVLLSAINPKQYKMLQPIGSSEELFLPVLVAPGKSTGDENALLEVLEKMRHEPNGVKKLNMLGLDGLKKITEEEIEALEK